MKSIITMSAMLLLLGGCASNDNMYYSVNIDQDLEQKSDTFEIVKADKFWSEDRLNITAGPYRVTNADRGWLSSTTHDKFDWTLLIDDIDNKHFIHEQRVRFKFVSDSGNEWRVRCEKRGNGNFTQVNIGRDAYVTNHGAHYIAYQCDFKSDDKKWALVVEHSSQFGTKAYFQTPDHQVLDVESFFESPRHPVDNGHAGMYGYYLVNKGNNVAAVSTLPLGQMWMDSGKPATMQDNIAMASVGLWFYHNGFDTVEVESDA